MEMISIPMDPIVIIYNLVTNFLVITMVIAMALLMIWLL